MKIRITNDFHNTTCILHVKGNKLSAGQVRRCRRELCGIAGCTCGDFIGARGYHCHGGKVIMPRSDGGAYVYDA